jgi:hypothetical protein
MVLAYLAGPKRLASSTTGSFSLSLHLSTLADEKSHPEVWRDLCVDCCAASQEYHGMSDLAKRKTLKEALLAAKPAATASSSSAFSALQSC